MSASRFSAPERDSQTGAPGLGKALLTPQMSGRSTITLRALSLSYGLLLGLTALKLAWAEFLGPPPPFLLYFSAIVVAAWSGGWVLGLAVTLSAGVLSTYFFVPPRYSFHLDSSVDVLRFVVFIIEGGVITALTARWQLQRMAAAQAAQAAQLSLAKLESVLAAVDDGITVQDAQGKLIYANQPAATLVGFASPSAFLAASVQQVMERFELFTPEGTPFSVADLPGRLVLRGEPAPEQLVRFRVRATGEERWALVRARPVVLDGAAVPFAVNVFHDLTALRRHEEELRLSQEWLATALRSIGDAVIATDARGRVMFMNSVAEQLTGWSDTAARQLPLGSVFRILEEETRTTAENPVERVLREERMVGLANHTVLVSRDGREIALDDSAAPIRSQSGELVGTVLVFRDVSLKREQERQVVQASRAKDEFLAMLGHELRNPLAPILTALDLMKLRGSDVFERERAIVERQVKHVVRLVDDLLDISRITSGKVELAKEPVELADTVAKALELAGPLIEERQHSVTVAVPEGLVVQGDPIRLAQVVSNLLTNAAKYTPVAGQIEVFAAASGDNVSLYVRDNGLGIEPELLPRVFDLFVQGGQALDRAKGGLGLGLAIVRSVIELHGGRVSASSEGAGRGSEFQVSLPARMRVSDRVSAVQEPVRAAGGAGASVLVVDDNVDALELLAEALRMVGHEIHTAHDAASALRLARSVRPDVALLDIGLPVMDGYELARKLRAMPGLENIKLAALTGYGQLSDKQRARDAGFEEHLVKPISIATLQTVVTRLLAG
jgi:PAS domain S-box-containing protein